MYFFLNLYIMPILLKSHYSEFHRACHWLCYSELGHKARNCISSLQKLQMKQLILHFSMELGKEKTLTLK